MLFRMLLNYTANQNLHVITKEHTCNPVPSFTFRRMEETLEPIKKGLEGGGGHYTIPEEITTRPEN